MRRTLSLPLVSKAAIGLALLFALLPSQRPASASGVAGITAGYAHTCALTTAGGVKCWGSNYYGTLGDGTTTDSATPVDVCQAYDDSEQRCTEPLLGVISIAAGTFDTCALTSDGRVKCWGHDWGPPPVRDYGPHPEDVGVSSVAALAVGESNCAITTVGRITCWTPRPLSVAEVGVLDEPATSVTGGIAEWVNFGPGIFGPRRYGCALTRTGRVKCWGGAFGDAPMAVGGLEDGATAVAGTCALTPERAAGDGGGVKCWRVESEPMAQGVEGLESGVAAINTTETHTCVVTTAGGVKCWGLNNDGQLGDGTTTSSTTPVDVLGLAGDVVAVAPGGFAYPVVNLKGGHTCAMTSAGRVQCWGRDYGGTPVDIVEPGGAVNCDVSTSCIEAALILQFTAGLVPWLPATKVDVNGDGRVDAVDAALVLQFQAGLLPALPLPEALP
jgi:hypothetical protein